jgi:hypothetical protein
MGDPYRTAPSDKRRSAVERTIAAAQNEARRIVEHIDEDDDLLLRTFFEAFSDEFVYRTAERLGRTAASGKQA